MAQIVGIMVNRKNINLPITLLTVEILIAIISSLFNLYRQTGYPWSISVSKKKGISEYN